MSSRTIAILTVVNDLHALALKKEFEGYDDVQCHIIPSNNICGTEGISWAIEASLYPDCIVPTRDGSPINLKDVDIVWWRRARSAQIISLDVSDPFHIDLINNDCRETILGTFLTKFGGIWINQPHLTSQAENKLIQLKAAQKVGFRIPRTLISQNPTMIRQFCEGLDNQVIVKPVRGTPKYHLYTKMIKKQHLESDESIKLSPAIYQEYIPGTEHIRVHCFGDSIYPVLIESEALDWRQDLESPTFSDYELSPNIEEQLRIVLRILGLRMGVVDLKISNEPEPIWLEINPQGQFLFSEGLSGVNLSQAFAKFLYEVK